MDLWVFLCQEPGRIMQNSKVLAAMRRNRQSRGLQDFLARFRQGTGLALRPEDVLDADVSVPIEQLLESTIEERLKDGSLSRTPDLHWEDVQAKLGESFSLKSATTLMVFMCHHPDFVLRLPAALFVANAKPILDFDRDSVYAIAETAAECVGIDAYTSELSHQQRFTFDKWESPHTPVS
jgi:hypothetical protein